MAPLPASFQTAHTQTHCWQQPKMPGPSQVDVKVVALTGTGSRGRTCHPSAIGRLASLLGSAVQPSVPPRPPHRDPIVCRASPALLRNQHLSGPVPGSKEEGGGLPRSEGDNCLDLEFKRRESQGPVGITYAKKKH